MTISILSNLASLRALRQMDRVSTDLAKGFERLSSGSRINNAGDDAAGLAISESLRNSVQIAKVALRNTADAISVVSIADAAFGEITSILYRMAELAQQSSNGVFSNFQRSALSLEFQALGSEIERIATTTTFNSVNLLSGSSQLNFQVGFTGLSSSQIVYLTSSTQGTLEALALGRGSSLSYSLLGNTADESVRASRTALEAVITALADVGSRRGLLGALESRLSTAVNTIGTQKENYAAAESRIRDVDVAKETADLLRRTILQQTSVAVLAQANQSPALALKLLQS